MAVNQLTRVVLVVCGVRFAKTLGSLARIPLDGEKGFPLEVADGRTWEVDVDSLTPEADDGAPPTFTFLSDNRDLFNYLDSIRSIRDGWEELRAE